MPATQTQEFKDGRWVNRWESQYWAELLVRYRDQFPEPLGVIPDYNPDAGWGSPSSPERHGPGVFLADWQEGRRRQIRELRESADRTASGWGQLRVTLPQGDAPRAVEERAVLLHELVLHGCHPRYVPGGEDAWAECAGRGHPLFRMPPTLLPVEQYVSPDSRGRTPPAPLPDLGGTRPTVSAAVEPALTDPATAAVRVWQEQSRGIVEVREFTLVSPFTDADAWAGWFRALPLASTQAEGLDVVRVSAVEAFRECFLAARSGGAHGWSAGAAYGRLHTWESFRWLTGAGSDAPCDVVAERAAQCRWFGHDTDWFYHVAWDLGLICVRPDGHSLAALAATDRD